MLSPPRFFEPPSHPNERQPLCLAVYLNEGGPMSRETAADG